MGMQMNTPSASIRRFARRDLAAALTIQTQVYPALLVESEAAFASRLDAAHPYCLAATVEEQLAGYLLAHGWHRNSPPELGAPLSGAGPVEILFIHDLAVATTGQGLGIGRRLVDHAFDLAVHDGLKSAELVAVEGAAGFWKNMGFVTLDATPEIVAKLAGYGRGATWMGRLIG
jgi:ribosomal protein S18 acetylase RimI-like enzyme